MTAVELSKKEHVEKYFNDHPGSSTPEVIEGLKKKGIEVSGPTVASVKSLLGLTNKRGANGKPTAAATAKPTGGKAEFPPAFSSTAEMIAAAAEFVKKAGSVSAAMEVLRSLQTFSQLSK